MDNQNNSNSDSLTYRLELLKLVYEMFTKKELDLTKDKSYRNYQLSPLPNESSEFIYSKSQPSIKLSKYVIQESRNSDQLDSQLLEKDSVLYEDLLSLIREEVGDDYITIFCRETDAYMHNLQIFGVKFFNSFNKGACGTIAFSEQKQQRGNSVLSIRTEISDKEQTQVALDIVYPKAMKYIGADITNKNVLFFGFDVEANRYLHHFFMNCKPKGILNIIPYRLNAFMYDNVD
jgi:hypothetical protein